MLLLLNQIPGVCWGGGGGGLSRFELTVFFFSF